MIDTNETLLERVKATGAHDAWREFYQEYWAVILAYARKLGLNQHQADEVLQETMVALMRQLPGFCYDREKGRFRNFLLTIVHRKSLAAFRRAKRERDTHMPWDSELEHHGAAKPGHGDATTPAEVEMQARWRESVVEVVLDELARDPRLGPETLAVFRAYAIEGRPVAAVAAEFGLKENAIYQIKNRLIRRVQGKVARRLRDSGGGPA